MHPRELLMNQEAQSVLHEIYMLLLRKLKVAKKYSDVQDHGPTKLTAYFTLLLYCCPTKTEKLMVFNCSNTDLIFTNITQL